MAIPTDAVKGTRTVVLFSTSVSPSGSADLTGYIKTVNLDGTPEIVDLTTLGNNSKVKGSALKDHKFTCAGVYGTGSSGTPRSLFRQHEGDYFTVTYRPEGTAVSKPQVLFTAVLSSYKESVDVAGYIMWDAEFDVSGDITESTQ